MCLQGGLHVWAQKERTLVEHASLKLFNRWWKISPRIFGSDLPFASAPAAGSQHTSWQAVWSKFPANWILCQGSNASTSSEHTLSPFQIEVEPNLQSFTLLVLETSPQTSWIRGSSWMRGAKQKCTAGCTSRIGQNQPQLGGALCIPEVHVKQVPGHD